MARSLSAGKVPVNVPQVALRILELIGEILPHLLTIEDDGTLLLNGDFNVATMASFLCSCNSEKASAGDNQDDTPIPPTLESAPVLSLATSEAAPSSTPDSKAPTPGKKVTPVPKASASTDSKKATSSKNKAAKSKPGVRTRITNRLRPEVKEALAQSIKNLKEGEFRRRLEDEIIDVIETTIAAKELREKNPNLTTIKTVRFSRATFKDLEDMGAKANSPGAEPIKLDREKTDEVVGLSEYVTLKSFKDGWERDWEVLCANLLSALKFFGDKVEPRTRSLVDDLKKAALRILEATPRRSGATQGKGVVLFELNVNQDTPSASSDTNLVKCGTTGTRLTGRFDYFSVITEASDADEELILELKAVKGLKGIVVIIAPLKDAQFFLCITETKRLLATFDELEAHCPQVIAQSLAVLQITNRQQVPWCLTDGHKWIFGLTWRFGGKEGFRFETTTIDWLTETENIKRPEDLRSCSEMILKVIIGWATTEPEKLKELMMGWREAAGRKE